MAAFSREVWRDWILAWGEALKFCKHIASLMLALMAGPLAAQAQDVSGPVLVFDPATGDVISQDRAGEPWYPASLTKLMTAFVIFKKLRNGSMKLDQKLTVSELAHAQPASHTGIP